MVVRVNDHAVVRYLERVVGLDVEALRADIAATCERHQGAPSVRRGGARFMICNGRVVRVLTGEHVPHYTFLKKLMREAE